MIHIDSRINISDEIFEKALDALRTLKDGTGEGSEYTGWVWLPEQTDENELAEIMETAEKIRQKKALFVNVGIGGSYLAAKSAVELLRPDSGVCFAGTGFTEENFENIRKKIENKEFYANIVTKSGNTCETMLAFEQIRGFVEEKYGEREAQNRIICTTDYDTDLCKLSRELGYKCFYIPHGIGGRFSALTCAGLLPMAAAGINIYKVISGALKQMESSLYEDRTNPSLLYAAMRQLLYSAGKKIEMFSYPGEKLRYFAEWWKQLFAESEGKNRKGIFPASCQISADLHSLGQYIQCGERTIFETMFSFYDELRENTMLRCVTNGVCEAHSGGGVPLIKILADSFDEENLGAMYYFFETACGISAYMMGVNPFDQPGVEEYKKHMNSILEQTRFERV